MPGKLPPHFDLAILVDRVLASSERLHLDVLLAAEEVVSESSKLLRALEGEVLVGTPVLMRFAGNELKLRDMYAPVRVMAQTLLRVARRERTCEPVKEQPTAEGPTTVRLGGPSTTNDGPSVPLERQPVQVGHQVDEATPETGAPPPPPVDVADVAAHLLRSIAELESVWSAALKADAVLAAGETDKSRFAALAAAVYRSAQESSERLSASGGVVVSRFPLSDEDVAALHPDRPLEAGPHAAFLPQLYSLQQWILTLQYLHQPSSLELGPRGKVLAVTFDPGALERLKAQSALLARCSALASHKTADMLGQSEPDGDAERHWLTDAAVRALDAGLPEAVVLYAHLAVRAHKNWPPETEEAIRRTVRAFLDVTSSRDLLAVVVPLAQHVVALLTRDEAAR